MKLSVIIPIYNEYNNIDEVIKRINAVELPPEVSGVEMVLVDDGSEDGTISKLEKYKNDKTMIVHESRLNFGKGTATRIGLTYVTGDVVLIQDADLAREFFKMLDATDWIQPLSECGVFKEPPTGINESGARQHAPWPASRYLVRMAAKSPEKVATIFRSVKTNNTSVVRDMLDAAIKMPPAIAAIRMNTPITKESRGREREE